jgi:hypothetical protein
MSTPIALSDSELDIIMHAAAPLQPQDRDAFLKDVAGRLAATSDRGDGVVYQIVRDVQRKHFDPPIGIDGPKARKFA